MADLKDLYSNDFLLALGNAFHAAAPSFKVTQFQTECQQTDWADLKLMERRDRITAALHAQLPTDYQAAAQIIQTVGPQFTGLTAVCLPNYAAVYGLDDWATSMDLLNLLTRYSSAEFAIRPFLLAYPAATERQMLTWADDANVDVRRLASEGIRPRLPWGLRLKPYVADPAPVFQILERLIQDESSYVQKSVANNLNDISKDHPDQVVAFAQEHWHQSDQTDWILTRGLRTLFKQGRPEVLALQGYAENAAQALAHVRLTPAVQSVRVGGQTTLQYQLTTTAQTPIALYLGYRVHYVRQNKTDAFKDFFIKRTILAPQQSLSGELKIKWRQLTTRKLYPGRHTVELLVNTRVVAVSQIDLQAAGN